MEDDPQDNEENDDLTDLPDIDDLGNSDILRLRKNYKNALEEKESDPVEIKSEEIFHLYNQFCNFATLQMLSIIANQVSDKRDGDNPVEPNDFLNDMINNFVSQLKISIYRGLELQELKQQKTKLFEVLGQDLMKRENKYSKNKLTQLIKSFEIHIRSSLLMDDDEEDEDYHE